MRRDETNVVIDSINRSRAAVNDFGGIFLHDFWAMSYSNFIHCPSHNFKDLCKIEYSNFVLNSASYKLNSLFINACIKNDTNGLLCHV